MSLDHILIIGFGGPPRPEDVLPFLQEVTRGVPIPPARLQDVAHHYAVTGGASAYNEYTQRLVAALTRRLRVLGVELPVVLGMRNWHPFLHEALAQIQRQGLRRGLGVVLAPHRADASWEKYLRNVEDARTRAGAAGVQYDYLGPWHDHPLFIAAQADEVRQVLARVPAAGRAATHLLFSAHSIPVDMAARCQYVQEFETSSRLVAAALAHAAWSLAYQSRSGSPRQPWLEPDVLMQLRELQAQGVRRVVLVPIGFLSNHTEVLYDLDIEARQEAERLGIEYLRASTVMDHPHFVEMFAQLIQARLRQPMAGARSA